MSRATLRRQTALALARALQAGPRTAPGLAARMQACLGDIPPQAWITDLAARCARMAGERWARLSTRSLACWIEQDQGFEGAWLRDTQPYIRRYILRPGGHLRRPPLGLDDLERPAWTDAAALAQALGVSDAALWRLTLPSAWQRATPLPQQHYAWRWQAKRQGGWRLLEVPEPYLRALQQKVLHQGLNPVPPHERAYGFVAGRSVIEHAQQHTGQAVILKFDLQDFFTSIRASRVHALWTTLGYPETVATLLTRLCTVATPEPVLQRWRQEGGAQWHQVLRAREPHLPQGAPTSPALANLCAFGLDLRLEGLAHAHGARYSRYADDVVISGSRALLAARARLEGAVLGIVQVEGFALNPRKTRCETQAGRQTVCHIVVNQHPNMVRTEFDRLKAILHGSLRDGPSAHNRESVSDWRAHLHGRVAWLAQLNPDKARRLQTMLQQIDWSR
ncbi:MAG: reverse transcriptase family protein [Ideonella sp.]|nr:reverse transcriptase family protein [Ideonella sp.]